VCFMMSSLWARNDAQQLAARFSAAQ
jgi:hypothetical protein